MQGIFQENTYCERRSAYQRREGIVLRPIRRGSWRIFLAACVLVSCVWCAYFHHCLHYHHYQYYHYY